MGELSCGMKCLKFLLFAFNFIVWACGIVVLGVGIYSRIKISDWKSIVSDSTIPNAANIMIAAGCFVMIIGFLGCCGAWKESKCLLITYAIALILIFVLEIAAGIFAYTKKGVVLDELKLGLNKTISISYGQTDDSSKGMTKSIDWFQQNVKCCGVYNPSDWNNTDWKKGVAKNVWVPESCCMDQKSGCSTGSNLTDLSIYSKGCVPEGEKYVKDHLWQIGGVGVGIAFVQFLGIVISLLLCRSIGYEQM